MNKVILMGRLTDAPKLYETASGTIYSRFSVAVSRRFAKDGQQDTDFINCVAWRKTAEFLGKYFSKGQMIALCGRLEQSKYEKDGNMYTSYSVAAEEIYFTGSKRENMNTSQNNTADIPSDMELMGFQTVESEELPF